MDVVRQAMAELADDLMLRVALVAAAAQGEGQTPPDQSDPNR
jgi:hypothetical protein